MGLRLGLMVGLGFAVYKRLQARQDRPEPSPADRWPPVTPVTTAPRPVPTAAPRPAPVAEPAPARAPAPAPAAPKPTGQAWVEPQGGACPTSHPIKAKLSSKIFHLPGMSFYDRTNADRCYASETAAEADGLHKAKR